MCGRLSLLAPASVVLELFGVVEAPVWTGPKYNLAPTQDLLVVRAKDGRRVAQPMRWGLVPSWAKDLQIGNKMINARAETLAEKSSFRNAFKRRRGLVVTDGFYEWERRGKEKRAWRIGMADGRPFAFGALYEHWRTPEQTWISTVTIITTEANTLVGQIHDRMPVIVEPEHQGVWLDPDVEASPTIAGLLAPRPAAGMVMTRVSSHVNDVRHEDPIAAAPLTGPEAEQRFA